ncbi:hypothetical protein [Streptomyces sp. KR80]|uniref:hypothetical protein n=1 Tax=Streptomyces sp. KR80 TaxID=3457426 RepID=UPI003FCFBF6C
MAHGAHPDAPTPAPRANIVLARDCHECRGWGTVITVQGRHELCPYCQAPLGRNTLETGMGAARLGDTRPLL